MGLWVFRAAFAAIFTWVTFSLQPFDLPAQQALGAGLLLSVAIIVFEMRVRHVSLRSLTGAALGSILGILVASLISLIIERITFLAPNTASFFQVLVLAIMTYLGLVIGISKGDRLNLSFGGLLMERTAKRSVKVLDTSVIIDGRASDVVETGFLEGELLIPQFVLRELQLVADSSDSVKRNRGRRGLDILQRIQKSARTEVQIVEQDYPQIKEVDLKLIELTKELGAQIVTNDFNLNKVAQVRGVEVLNINELANALRPVVLPGETMRVFILKEGKEPNQGVAYLDDGTMVVVDNARRMIGKTVDLLVTSVLQTTAGKMIFGKYQSNGEAQRREYERERVTRS